MFKLLRELSGFLGRDSKNQKDTNWTTIENALNNLQGQISQLVVHGDSSPQASQASVGADGTNYSGLKSRLDAEYNNFISNAQMTKITSDTGSMALNISDTTKDFLVELANLGVGLHTFYAASGVQNLPPTNHSIRGIAQTTSNGYTWVWCADYNNNIFTNYCNSGNWTGWQQLVSDSQYPLLVGPDIGYSVANMECAFPSSQANYLQVTFNFPKAYASPPIIMPGNITQSVSYSDTMAYPFIVNVTTTSFTVKVSQTNSANAFGTGTLKMMFLIFGKISL